MAKMIRYKHQGQERVAEVVKNKGIAWQIADGSFVPKKLVVGEPWIEEEETPEPVHATFAEALGEITKPHETPAAGAAKKAPKANPDTPRDGLVTLKQLCFELDLEPRIARRRLRKAVGQVGTGDRWEWEKDSTELAAVRKVLAGAE